MFAPPPDPKIVPEVIVPHHPYKPDAGIVGNVVAKRKHYFKADFYTIFEGKDDENFVEKTLTMTKFTGTSAFMLAGADIILFDRMGLVSSLRRGLFWGIPIIGGGLAYVSTVCFMASIRKKNNELNHFFGGQVAGAVVGAANKCFLTGMLTGIALGAAGAIYKTCAMHDMELFPAWGNGERTFPMGHKLDWTTYKVEQGNWVRELPKKD